MSVISAIVTAAGTPALTRAAAGAVTGVWGAGQNRTAGNQLVAVVTAGGTTATAAALNTPAGWKQQAVISNTPTTANTWAAVYTRTATGADAAPAFTATLTGTVAMTVTLLELIAADNWTPVDYTATYASGGAAGTLSAMAIAAPAGQVTYAPEDYGIAVFVQEAAAAVNTWNGAGGAWSNLVNDGATSSVLHTAIDVQPGVNAATALAETGHWTTNTTAFGAALLVAVGSQTGGSEVFTADASTTVSAGGTGAPAAGTPEIWTAASWSSFPAVSNTASPPMTFRVNDPAVPGETIAVLNTATGLVIRGADGTTPAAHTAGFTIFNVIGAGFLTSVSPPAVNAPAPTGNAALDFPAIRAALRAAYAYQGTQWAANSATVRLAPGIYQGDAYQLAIPPGVTLELASGTQMQVACSGGATVDAITIGAQSGIKGTGPGQPGQSAIAAWTGFNARTLISNAQHAIQESASIDGLYIDVGNGPFGVAVVEFNGVFVNSGISRCVINCNYQNGAGIPGLLVTGSPVSGFGPFFVKDVWIFNSAGPCMKVTENNPPQGSCTLWMEDVDLEHPSFPYHTLEIDGFGSMDNIQIDRLHTENNVVTTSGHVAGVYVNGVKMLRIDGYSCLAGSTANKYCVWIENNAGNGTVTIDNMINNNTITPTIQDDLAGFSVGTDGRNVSHYNGPGQGSKYEGSMVLGGDLELGAQTVALASTAVNAMNGNIVDVAALAAGVTVAAPLSPKANQLLIYRFVENGTGGFAVAWNAIFRVASGNAAWVTTANKATVIGFRYDATLTAWVQVFYSTGI